MENVRSSNNNLNSNDFSSVHSDYEGGRISLKGIGKSFMKFGKKITPIPRIQSVRKGIREDYSPAVYEYILRNYDDEIVSVEVCREELANALNKAMSLMSLGKWDTAKKNYGYDTFYHLSIVAKTSSGKNIIIEKNAVIDVSTLNHKRKGMKCRFIPEPKNRVRLGEMMKKAEAHMKGKGYFKYDPFNNNCQVFVFNVLRANGLMDDELKKFILQDIDGVVSAQKSYFPKVAKSITDMGGLADKFLNGETKREEIKEALKPEISEEAYEGGVFKRSN